MYQFFFKRVIDFILALVALIILSPLILLTTIFLLFANQGKPFFIHPRPGKNGKIFKLIKFKTMNDKKDKNGEFLPFDQRVTKTGAFVRKYSLDELLQLINVLKGDMSIVGNRPLPLYEAELLTSDRWAERFNAPAGITGLWQVEKRGSSEMSEEERKVYYNNYYFH